MISKQNLFSVQL